MSQTKVLLGIGIAAATGVGVFVWNSNKQKTQAPPEVAQPTVANEAPASAASHKPFRISGKVTVKEELKEQANQLAVIFVILRSAAGGPPYAVARLENPRSGFPLSVALDEKNLMMPGAPFPENPKLVVRFDADGSAGPETESDLVGELELGPGAIDGQEWNVEVSRKGKSPAQ